MSAKFVSALLRLRVPMLLALALVACQSALPQAAETHSAPAPTPAADAGFPATVQLAVGETVALGGKRMLRLQRISADSRCPKNAQCVWAGEVTLAFELVAPNLSTTFELAERERPRAVANSLEFELTGFASCPAGHGKGAAAECATLTIRPLALR